MNRWWPKSAQTRLSLGAAVLVSIGLGLVVKFSHGAGPFVDVEPESGQKTGAVATCADGAASGGSYAILGANDCNPPPPGFSLSAQLATGGSPIQNRFSHLTTYAYNQYFSDVTTPSDPNYTRSTFPTLRYVQLMAATGGCYPGFPGCNLSRDLFTDPAHPSPANYKFAPLVQACNNVVRQGMLPYFVTGHVPPAMSQNPAISVFQWNLRPPADWAAYHDYIKAAATAIKTGCHPELISQYKWGVLTEGDCSCSFNDGFGQDSTTAAYFRLYDTSVDALTEALGAANLKVGVHGMWHYPNSSTFSVRQFFAHAAAAHKPVNFVANSFYEVIVGSPGDVSILKADVDNLRGAAVDYGFNVDIGIDELGFFSYNNAYVPRHTLANGYQASWNGILFKKMEDLNVQWVSIWALSTNSYWTHYDTSLQSGVLGVGTHVMNLVGTMTGANRLQLTSQNSPRDSKDLVNGVAAYNPASHKAYALFYNHAADPNAGGPEDLTFNLGNIKPLTGSTVNLKIWQLDDTHGNYLPFWKKDLPSCGYHLTASVASLSVPDTFNEPVDCWRSHEYAYALLSAPQPVSSTAATPANQLQLTQTLPPHSVLFIEVDNAVTAI